MGDEKEFQSAVRDSAPRLAHGELFAQAVLLLQEILLRKSS